MNKMSQKVEFIESYIKDGGDYKWDDNHGEFMDAKSETVSDGYRLPLFRVDAHGLLSERKEVVFALTCPDFP